MSKPMVVTLPVVMLLLDYWPLGRLQSRKVTNRLMDIKSVSTNDEARQTKLTKAASKRKISPSINRKSPETRMAGMMPLWPLLEKIPFFAFSLILVIIIFYAPDMNGLYTENLKNFPIPLLLRITNAPVAFVTYLGKTFWPHDMAVIYPFPDHIPAGQVIFAVLLILMISAAVMVMAKRWPYLFVGWLWYSITILPVIGIIQISFTAPYAMADRYYYLPSIGIAMMLAWGFPALMQSENMRRKILFPAGVIFIALLSFVTWQQCRYWKNSIELWNHTLRVTKDNYMAHYSLGYALFDEGKFEDAVEQYNEAIRLRPNAAEAFFNRGNAYTSFSQYQKALDDFNQAIRLKENYADAYNNRAVVFISLGSRESGCHDARKACTLGNCKALELAKCPPLKDDHAETYEKR
jgi:tetratricopeptide (TPR) repeat protein